MVESIASRRAEAATLAEAIFAVAEEIVARHPGISG